MPSLQSVALAQDDGSRRAAYCDLLASAPEDVPLTELRLALNQDQPIGNARLYREIEAMTGQRRELRKRGRRQKPEGRRS